MSLDIFWWIFLCLLVLLHFGSTRFSHKKRINLRAYIVHLMLDDEIRERHKRTFEDWISKTRASDAKGLSYQAQNIIEIMADKLDQDYSVLSASEIMWRVKNVQEQEDRDA
jgi:hypothetical protein